MRLASRRRSARRQRAGGAGLSAVLALAAAVGGLAPVASPARAAAAGLAAVASSCLKAKGPFHVSGTKVIGSNGKVYVPYGITVPGLSNSNYGAYTPTDDQQITAAATAWCSNTVRLQVGQDNLVGAGGGTFSAAFLKAIEAEVSRAESYGMVVVINAQTESVGNEPAPTHATAVFWKDLTSVYGHDGQVVYDLFNEPRMDTGTAAHIWNFWQHGGSFAGQSYLGMQNLVTGVRAAGAANLLWIEGPRWSSTLAEVPAHRISGGRLEYAIHHPAGAHRASAWSADFGFLVTKGIAPVVDGEWSNWAAARGECWPDAPTAVPHYLSYLGRHGIGLTVWQLRQGVMIESANMADPTHLRANWSCTNGLDEGAGAEVMNWYKKNNG